MSGWDDPLRSTLLVLPAAVAAFAALAWLARRRGARPIPPALLRFELAALAALTAAALAREPLGLAEATPAVAAALLGLAVAHAGVQLHALRPLLDERPGQARRGRPSLLFLAVPAVLYLALLPWASERRAPDGDEPYYLLLTHSLAYDLDTDLADEYAAADWRFSMDRPVEPQPGDPTGPAGQVYSRHNALLPLVLAPAYRLAGKAGALTAMAFLAALLVWLTLRLALAYFPDRPGEALLASALLALAPPLLLYAHQVWVEVPAAVLLALALTAVVERPSSLRAPAEGERAGRRRRAAAWLALALPLVLLPLLKIRFVLVAAALLGLAFVRWPARDGAPRRSLVAAAGLLAGTLGALLLVNRAVYGNPLKIHTWNELTLPAVSLASTVEGFLGLFWDAAFGLFGCAPLWLLTVPAVALGAVRRSAAAGHLAAVALPYLVFVAPRVEWYGGWSPPFRYGLVLMPLLTVALVPLLAERRRAGARVLLGCLGAATVALALIWLAVPGASYDLADGRTRLLDVLSSELATDAARLFPSHVRPRLASWLWPPVSAALAILAWWLPRRRRAAGAERPATALAGGVALFLAAAAAVPALASLLPTRAAEPEDPWVVHRGGHVHPETWTMARSGYRGGWVIRPGESVEMPLTPGGERARLALHVRFGRNNPDPLTLEVLAGEEPLATWRPRRAGIWRRIELGPFELPRGRPLVLRAKGPPRAGEQNGFLLDRVEVDWR